MIGFESSRSDDAGEGEGRKWSAVFGIGETKATPRLTGTRAKWSGVSGSQLWHFVFGQPINIFTREPRGR
jgi:hypothetical protein